jgi:hypothetical protein
VSRGWGLVLTAVLSLILWALIIWLGVLLLSQ